MFQKFPGHEIVDLVGRIRIVQVAPLPVVRRIHEHEGVGLLHAGDLAPEEAGAEVAAFIVTDHNRIRARRDGIYPSDEFVLVESGSDIVFSALRVSADRAALDYPADVHPIEHEEIERYVLHGTVFVAHVPVVDASPISEPLIGGEFVQRGVGVERNPFDRIDQGGLFMRQGMPE